MFLSGASDPMRRPLVRYFSLIYVVIKYYISQTKNLSQKVDGKYKMNC